MTSTPIWARLARLAAAIGIFLLLADLAVLGRYAYFATRLAHEGARIGPILGG